MGGAGRGRAQFPLLGFRPAFGAGACAVPPVGGAPVSSGNWGVRGRRWGEKGGPMRDVLGIWDWGPGFPFSKPGPRELAWLNALARAPLNPAGGRGASPQGFGGPLTPPCDDDAGCFFCPPGAPPGPSQRPCSSLSVRSCSDGDNVLPGEALKERLPILGGRGGGARRGARRCVGWRCRSFCSPPSS